MDLYQHERERLVLLFVLKVRTRSEEFLVDTRAEVKSSGEKMCFHLVTNTATTNGEKGLTLSLASVYFSKPKTESLKSIKTTFLRIYLLVYLTLLFWFLITVIPPTHFS